MNKKVKLSYVAMLVGACTGIVASFIQLIDKMALLENSGEALSCNINSVFNCSDVLSAWQSSLFGFPNTMISLTFFVFFGAIAIVGLSGGAITRKLRLWTQGMALFMLAFGLWFLLQSIYAIGALCLLCMVLFASLLVINWGWLRANSSELPIAKQYKKILAEWISKGYDTLIWLSIAVVLALMMVQKFI